MAAAAGGWLPACQSNAPLWSIHASVEHACIDACMLHSVDVLGAAQRAATKQDEEAFSIRIAKCRKTKYFPRITLA